MARKPSERRHAKEELEDINLTPIMSILVILIPMLLFAFTFFEVKLMQVAAPKMGPPKPKQEKEEKKPLQLTVIVTEKGFILKQQADFEEPDVQIPKRELVDLSNNTYFGYDYPRLYSELMKKKKQYSDERTLNLAADFDIPWSVIARTIDASRVQLAESQYDTEQEYAQAGVKLNSDKEPEPLFDTVVFMVDPDRAN